MKRVYIYNKYNRFWHWAQAAFIIFLAVTGFEIHGSYHILGFENAIRLHNNTAFALIALIVMTVFWDLATGEWKQYIPTLDLIKGQIDYYITGIFKNAPHPTHKTMYNKFNPLQRITYFGIKVVILPVMIISGLIYYLNCCDLLSIGGVTSPGLIAGIHMIGAFFLVGFIVIHVYLTTTGYKPFSSIKAMLFGWEEMSEHEAEIALDEGLKVKIEELVDGLEGYNKKEHTVDELVKAVKKQIEK